MPSGPAPGDGRRGRARQPGYRPVITGNADVGVRNENQQPEPPAGIDDGPARVLRQPDATALHRVSGNERRARVRAAVRAGREILRDIERLILLEAVTAYMDVVRDQAVVLLQENNVQVLSRELKATQDRFSVGEVTRTDVAQAQARRAGSVSALDLARANLKTSRAAFERVVGHPPSNLVDPGVPERLLPKSVEEAIAIGTRENALVIASLYREQGARHTVDRIRGELLPQARLEASYEDRRRDGRPRRGRDDDRDRPAHGANLRGRRGLRACAKPSIHTSAACRRSSRSAPRCSKPSVAWSQLQAARGQLQSDTVQVESNRTALAGVREERVGQRTLLDVLNAEQELLNSEVALVTTRRNLVVAAYSVLSTIGKLDAATLGAASQVYDPRRIISRSAANGWGSASRIATAIARCSTCGRPTGSAHR